jgi:type 1 glutamine amidotransferase
VAARLLVFSRTVGFRHDSIGAGLEALRSLAKAGDWDLEATEDPASFHAERLARFDAVVFLNTNGTVLDDPAREALVRFVRSGKAFVGVHGAADTETEWPWYVGLVGAKFKAHPAIQTARLVVEEATHPATRAFPSSFERTDEWYGFHENPRARVRVLLTLDESSYSPGDSAMGADHPIAWCHDYAGGRAFYTGLGHTEECYREPSFREHLAGGTRWALGAALAPRNPG